jgi:hypothetical protein
MCEYHNIHSGSQGPGKAVGARQLRRAAWQLCDRLTGRGRVAPNWLTTCQFSHTAQ